MGYDDDTRLACREILAGGMPSRLFLPLRAERDGAEFRPWGYGTTNNQEVLRACAEYAVAKLNAWAVVIGARAWLLRVLGSYSAPRPPAGGEPWSYLPDRNPNSDRSPAEVGANIYTSHYLLAWVTAAYAAAETGDDEMYAAIKRHVGGRAALLNLCTVTCTWEGETGPHVITVGNRSAVPITGRQDWWAARLRGDEPSAWSARDGIIAEDEAALSRHHEMIAELGADDSMLPPVACERIEVVQHGGIWTLCADVHPIISSSGRRDVIGMVQVDRGGKVRYGEGGCTITDPLVRLGRGIGWQPNPRPWGRSGNSASPPPAKPTPPLPPAPGYLTPADVESMTAGEIIDLLAADPRRHTWGHAVEHRMRGVATELMRAGIKLPRP